MSSRLVRIGTRSSPMAVAQAERVATALRQLDADITVELVTLTTRGDRWAGDLAALGGKGAFTRELDRGQLDGEFDVAVHCLKDIPGDVPLPDGLSIAAHLPREDVHDALVCRHGGGLADLPDGAVVGTSSVRRRAQLGAARPGLVLQPVRGNANTRLAKLDAGRYDALVLAVAGLQRIGRTDRITAVLSVDEMLPAAGAGIITVTTRTDDAAATGLAARLADPTTTAAASAERALLAALSGHCHSPIAALATTEGDGNLRLRAAVYAPDGSRALTATDWAPAADADPLRRRVADALAAKGARDLIASIPH